jgi:hypothetical protein
VFIQIKVKDEKSHGHVVADAADYWGRHTKKFGGLSAKSRPGTSPGQFLRPPHFIFSQVCLPKLGGVTPLA